MRAYTSKAKARRDSASNIVRDQNTSKTAPSTTPCKKVKRLSKCDVSEFIVLNNIKTESELLAAAKQRYGAGEKDLYRFCVERGEKELTSLLQTTWRIDIALEVVRQENTPKIEKIESLISAECIENCGGVWLTCAKQVLRQNNFNVYVYAAAIRDAITKGRQKNNNIMFVGPTNCGKSFLLNPLEIIFRSFVNLANGRYAWVGLDTCEIAYLNDFRWSTEIISWSDFLLLLEGQTVHLPRPKNMYATDLCISRDNHLSIFATSKCPVEFVGKYNVRDDHESVMMSTRWKVLTFTHQIPMAEAKLIPRCPHFFSVLTMRGSEEDS